MKALNQSRNVTIKYPRNTPRISRKRLWYDRSEWRQSPQNVYEGGQRVIDENMAAARRPLGDAPYNDFPDLMDRAGRVAIRRY